MPGLLSSTPAQIVPKATGLLSTSSVAPTVPSIQTSTPPIQAPVATLEQDATAKSSVLDDIIKAPDNSTLGVIKNTILGIPKAAATIIPQIGQGIARDVGAAGVTALGKSSVPVAPNDKLSQFLFGSQPIPSLYENGKNYMVQNGTSPKVAAVEGLPFGMMLAISDVWGGPEEDAIKSIANASDEKIIKNVLDTHYPVLKGQSPMLAKMLSDIKDPQQISQVVRDALNKTAHNAVEETRPDVDETAPTYAPEEEESQMSSIEKAAEQHEALKNTPPEVPEHIPAEFKDLAQEAQKHPDAHSFLSAVANSPDEKFMDDLHTLRNNPIEGKIKTPVDFYKAVTESKEIPEIKSESVSDDEMAESHRLVEEARARSSDFLENWGKKDIPDKYDVQPGTWQAMLKDYSRNLPGDSKVDILDYLRTPEHVLERVGLQPASELLQNAKDSYRTTLAKELDKIKGWKDEVQKDGNPDSSRRIFKYLDGEFKETKSEMTETEYATAQKIKNYFKQWADRLGLPEENRVSNYVTHLFADTDEHGATVFDDPEMKNMMADQPAKSVYDPFLQKRINKPGYKQDVWAALDAYAKRGTRKEAFDPALSKLESMARPMDDSVYEYVTHLTHQINMRPARLDTLVDNLLKKTPGIGDKIGDRPVNRFTSKMRAIFNRAAVGLNVRSAVRILSQGANTYAKLGEKYTVLGYYDFIKNAAGRNLQDLVDAGVLKDSFIQDRKVGVYKSLLQKIEPALYTMFDTADKINRGSAFYGARRSALRKGLSMEQATLYAKRIVRDTHFDFSPVNSSVGTVVGLKGDITKSAMQFLDYTQRQGEFLTDMLSHGVQKGMDKDLQGAAHEFLGLLRWSAATYLFAATIGKAIGYTTSDILPALTADTNPLIRTGGDVATAVGDATSGNVAGAEGALADIVGSFIPGYSQGKNTVGGISDVNKGKVTNSSGQTVADVPQTPGNYVKGALFGPGSLSLDQNNKINDIYSMLDKQSKGSGATKSAYAEYQKLQQINTTQGPDAANTAYQQLQESNPDQAKDVLQFIQDQKQGITADEVAMKKLSVTNRAAYLANEFNSISDNSQRQSLWEKYISDKVITPAVSKALLPLLKK